MADEIFNTPLIPGAPLPRHEHRRLMVVFIIVAVIIIAALLGYYFSMNKSTAVPPSVAPVVENKVTPQQAIINELSAASKPLTASQTAQVSNLLKSPVKSTMTAAKKAATINELQTTY